MLASFVRITLLLALLFAGYKLYPRIKPAIQPAITNPQILGAEIVTPVIDSLNKILPDNLKIPTSKPNPANQTNETNSTNPANLSNLTNSVINEVKQKAGEAAQNQIDTVKKETGNAFCQALVETVKKQCGIQ